MESFNNFDYANNDFLFILKEEKPLTLEDLKDVGSGLSYQFGYYDHKLKKWMNTDHIEEIHLGDWNDLTFTDHYFKPLTECRDRMEYAYACMFADKFVDDIVKNHLPGLKSIKKPACRGVKKYYLQHWMEKYNFILEDFIFNDKYIVLHDDEFNPTMNSLIDNNFIDWNNVAECSLDDEGYNWREWRQNYDNTRTEE